eukprot:SAG31_NODE_1415_length_8443_cov_6.910986_2_plen_103_part_00
MLGTTRPIDRTAVDDATHDRDESTGSTETPCDSNGTAEDSAAIDVIIDVPDHNDAEFPFGNPNRNSNSSFVRECREHMHGFLASCPWILRDLSNEEQVSIEA